MPGAFYEILYLSFLQLFSHTLNVSFTPLWLAGACLLEGHLGWCDLSFSHTTPLMSFCSMLTSLHLPLRDSFHKAIVSCWGQPNTHSEIFKNIYRSLSAAKTAALAFSIPATTSTLWIVIHNAKNKAQGIWTALDAPKQTCKPAPQLTWCPTDLMTLISPRMLDICFKCNQAGLPTWLQGWVVG